jgi:hypothetical protein
MRPHHLPLSGLDQLEYQLVGLDACQLQAKSSLPVVILNPGADSHQCGFHERSNLSCAS